MSDFKLVKMTQEEIDRELDEEITMHGLKGAVRKRCDIINGLTGDTGYLCHREIQEYLNDILRLIELYGERTK